MKDYTTYSIGLDRLFDRLENFHNNSSYPPYNIVKLDDEQSLIEVAVAGFQEEDLNIDYKEDVLEISGTSKKEEKQYFYRGLAARDFNLKFALTPETVIVGASVENGLLKVLMKRVIPESKRSRKIPFSKTLELPKFDDTKLLEQ